MISWVKPVNPSHPYLENDPAPSFDPHHLRISPWLEFRMPKGRVLAYRGQARSAAPAILQAQRTQ